MILVDTSVWIDHLHNAEPRLVTLLEGDRVATHDGIVHELALGSLARRDEFIAALRRLHRPPSLRSDEFLDFVERERLWGRGLSVIDVHLLGAARIAHATLWTRDRRLLSAATELSVATVRE